MSFGLEALTARVHTRLGAELRRLMAHRLGGPAVAFLAALAGFAVVARLSYQMVDLQSTLEALWLPNGVIVALFVLVPRSWRLWVLLGVIPGELISDTLQGYPLHIALGFGLTDMLESALAGLIILKIARRRPRGDRQRDFFAILSGAAVAPIAGALVGAAITTGHWGAPFHIAFILWWFGDLTGILLVVSFAVSLASPRRATTLLRRLSAFAEVGLVVAVTGAVFGLTDRPIMFLVLLPVVGVALRHGLRATSFASLAFAVTATLLTASGHGPFVPFHDGPLRVMLAQGFITLTAAIAFLISATMTAQRRAERHLAESLTLAEAANDQVRASFDGAAIGMLLLGTEGVLLSANRSSAAMFRCSQSDLIATNGLDLIHPDDHPKVAGQSEQLTSITGHSELELRSVRKDGTEMIGRYTVSPILAADGSLLHLLVEIEDVTQLRRVEAELARSRALEAERDEQMRQAQRLETVGRLAGGVAHDFNNLLVGILGYNELALAKIGGGPGTVEIAGAMAAANDAAALTAQLLAHSRQQVLDPQVFDLRDAVTEITELLRRMIDRRVEIAVTLPDVEVLVRADRPQVGQVIMNLAVNAGDAMPSGGRLTIEVGIDTARQHAVMTVEDEGGGMDAETAARIYEPFFTTKANLGTGLGLSTVHGIVTQSRGQIAVASTVGVGTTFTVTLPLGKRDPAETPAAPAPTDATRGGEQILFVDDESTVRDVVAGMLRGRGYRVSVAASGSEAIALSRASAPGTWDIVVTDLAMTGLNGRETADAIRVHQPKVRTLYISGYTEDDAIRHGDYEPGVGFLQKPFSSAQLDAKIRALLDVVVLP